MSNCAVCHKPVKSGIVVHSECMELLQKTQQVGNKPMTNADRIRAMSDEDLAIMFAKLRADLTRLDRSVQPYSGRDANDNYDWLKQPVEVE